MSVNIPDLAKGTIITSRVRLARNVRGVPFKIKDPTVASEMVKKVYKALAKADTFNLYYMAKLPLSKMEAMKEKHLISQNLIDNRLCGAALINEDKSISIMVNEEDVLREQCFMKGLRLSEAYNKLNKIDDELAKHLDIAFDDEFGYLTACATNLGTGLRASVMLFLPALTESGEIGELVEILKEMGLTVRGLYGEGSEAEGYMYQISNELTLSLSEQEIIRSVEDAVERICNAERIQMKKLYSNKELQTLDRAKKSYGILTNAVLLPYSEFLKHIANVKLGVALGMLDFNDLDSIDDLVVNVRPYSLCELYGKNLSQTDRDLYRAEYVGGRLKKLANF